MRLGIFIGAALLLAASLSACVQPAGIRYPGLPTHQDGGLHVINFNVGQADAMLVLYKGKSILYDAGSPLHEPHLAAQRIPRRLDALLGHRHIDYFVLSHYHQDHVGSPGRKTPTGRVNPSGLYSLLDRKGVTIGTVIDRGSWTIGKPPATYYHYFKAMRRWLAEGKVQERIVAVPGQKIPLGTGVDVEVIVTSGNGWLDRLATLYPVFVEKNPPSENDYSVGIKVSLGNFEYFAAGDLSGENIVRRFGPSSMSYNDIESYIATSVGPIEVYRVNHHGSAHSSNACFTDLLNPEVSIVSSGRHNMYKHPHRSVYDRLKATGDLYITDGIYEGLEEELPSALGDVVGDDIEIAVAPSGQWYWVNGRRYESRSEAVEQMQATQTGPCSDTSLADFTEDNFKYLKSDRRSD